MQQSTRSSPGSTPAIVGILVALTSASCGVGYAFGTGQAKSLVTEHAETDLDCPANELRVEEGWGGRWEAYGCGRHAVYNAKCTGVKCDVQSGDAAVPWADRPTYDPGASH
jgi:hypothetical protein